MNYKNQVENLKRKCDVFLGQVENLGNECAWTDRALESVLAAAYALHQAYYGKENSVRDSASIEAQIRAAESAKGVKRDTGFTEGLGCSEFPKDNETPFTEALLDHFDL